MLVKFSVKNFKNFKDWFHLDLSDVKSYAFNPQCVRDGIVTKALIYGPNGCGKTNLGRAIFDIQTHLTDEKIGESYSSNYLNADTDNELAEFSYTFTFGDSTLEYCYGKKKAAFPEYERLLLNGVEIISSDRASSSVINVDLRGAESINRDMGDKEISAVKYVLNNAILTEDLSRAILYCFDIFVQTMMFDRAVDSSFVHRPETFNYLEKILSDRPGVGDDFGIRDFEEFLNSFGVNCKLAVIEEGSSKRVVFRFGNRDVDFSSAASTGTLGLATLYVRLFFLRQRISASSIEGLSFAPFIYIDEYDAFYHYKASEMLVKQLREYQCQAILTTHNTAIMSNDVLRPDCYFIMSDKDVKPLFRFTDKELRKAHNIEKMYRAGVFDG